MDFPAGPVTKTLHSQCRGPGFHPWSGNYIPRVPTMGISQALQLRPGPAKTNKERTHMLTKKRKLNQSLLLVCSLSLPFVYAILSFFRCSKYTRIKLTTVTIFNVGFNGISIFSVMQYQLSELSIPRRFPSSKTEALHPLNTKSPSSCPQSPGKHYLFFYLRKFGYSATSHEWSQTAFVLL